MKLAQYFSRYIIVSGITYLIDFFGFILFLNFFEPIIANLITKIFAALSGYYLQSTITYKTSLKNKKRIIKYFGSVLIYIPCSSLLIFVFIYFFKPVDAKIISDILLFLLTYIFTTKYIFKK